MNFLKGNTIWKIIIGAGFLIMLYFPIFLRLDHKPLRDWDESRNAVNALEMSENHKFLVKTFEGKPDLWETKPPLLTWLQVAGFRTLGYGELAVRLPSALATLALCIFLPLFFWKHFNAPIMGLLASLIIVTCNSFIHDHASRTGDHDAMLVCFEMIMLCAFFMYCEKGHQGALVSAGLFFMLAILTKSISVMMLVPGVLVYLLLQRKLMPSIKDKRLWAAIGLALIPVAAFYAAREMMAPGYLKAVWENELFPRYFNTASSFRYNESDLGYYGLGLYSFQFKYWIWFLVPALLVNIYTCKGMLQRFHNYMLLNAALFFLIISFGTTNPWYMLPLLAMLAVILGIGLYQTGVLAGNYLVLPTWLKYILFLAVCLAILYVPYSGILSKIMNTTEANVEEEYAYVFRRMEREMPAQKEFVVYRPVRYFNPLVFYTNWYNRHKGYKIEWTEKLDPEKAQYVIAQQEQLMGLLYSGQRFDIIFNEFDCCLLKTLAKSDTTVREIDKYLYFKF